MTVEYLLIGEGVPMGSRIGRRRVKFGVDKSESVQNHKIPYRFSIFSADGLFHRDLIALFNGCSGVVS